LIVRTVKDRKEKYGRYLAELFLVGADGQPAATSVNQTLLSNGHARPYSGGAR